MTTERLAELEKLSEATTAGPWQAELSEPFTLGGDCREVVALDSEGMVSRNICTFMLETDEHPDGKEFLEDVANAKLLAISREAIPELIATIRELQKPLAEQLGPTIELLKECESEVLAYKPDEGKFLSEIQNELARLRTLIGKGPTK